VLDLYEEEYDPRYLSTPAHFCARIILTPLSYKLPTVKTI